MMAGCGEKRPALFPRHQVSQLTDADIPRGRELIGRYGCVACHTIPGVRGPQSGVGPPLGKLALRGYVGGVLPNTPENLARWLRDPPSVDHRTAMPNVGLSETEARNIAAYLLTLR